MASLRRVSWRARAVCMARGCCSHNRVLPSISVKRNVTVPLGILMVLGMAVPLSNHASRNSQYASLLRAGRLVIGDVVLCSLFVCEVTNQVGAHGFDGVVVINVPQAHPKIV